ncbi:MAG: GNAT family N-acetyltransferase [bacterium]
MPSSSTLHPLKASEISEIGQLARTIWRQHYETILSREQVEYMLREKYAVADLTRYISATDQWFDVLRVDEVVSGFLRTSRASDERFKLEEIYIVQAARGRGNGRLLLERAESLAREQECKIVFLYVNRANAASIALYQRNGYVIAKSEVFDIGNGFVMDEHLMEKSLAG